MLSDPPLSEREILLRTRAFGARIPIVLLIGCLDALFYEELVLFAHYVDKSMSMQCLLDTIADSLIHLAPLISAGEKSSERLQEVGDHGQTHERAD